MVYVLVLFLRVDGGLVPEVIEAEFETATACWAAGFVIHERHRERVVSWHCKQMPSEEKL